MKRAVVAEAVGMWATGLFPVVHIPTATSQSGFFSDRWVIRTYFGVTRSPDDAWVAQQLREATPFGEGPRFLIRDNDNKFGAAFARVAEGTGIEVLTTPYQAPKANAICERFLGSVRRECLDFFLILNERHVRKIMKQYQAYFNQARPHQGLAQRLPCPPEPPQEQRDRGKIISLPVLGGLHHDYQRRAGARPSLPRAA
jgi:putative transposase